MRIKYILSLLAIVAISKNGFAQYANDAIRFSNTQPGATSRMKAVGNAGTAIGGDVSSISINPAGLGFFTRSEFSFTPEFNTTKNNSNYFGNLNSTTKNNGNLANAGVVFYTRLNTPRGQDKETGWLSMNFGAGYSHTGNFNETVRFNGANNRNSINDYYASLANSGGIDYGLAGWAYDHSLIDQYNTANPTYRSNALPNVLQANDIIRTGGQSEITIALGGNYSNRFYIGASVGIVDLEYKSTNVFSESGSANILEGTPPVAATRAYNSTYSQYQTTKGSGINVKVGAIYKLDENLRIGATVTSPTFMSIDDIYTEQLNTSFTGGASYRNGPEDYPLSYNFRTPFKASAGLSYFFGPYGFITGDAEFVDYSSTRISKSDSFDPTFDNNQIKANNRSVINTRIGAEFRPIQALAIRGGYNFMESPANTGQASTNIASGGLGYRFSNFYIDATYQHLTGAYNITPYTVATDTPLALVNRSSNNFFLTLGFRY